VSQELELAAARGDVQRIDIRLYIPGDTNRATILAEVAAALASSSELTEIISAYELESDGFGRLVPRKQRLA